MKPLSFSRRLAQNEVEGEPSLRIENIDSRRPTAFMVLSVGWYTLSNTEFSPEAGVGHFSRSCSFQWGIELAVRVGEVGIRVASFTGATFDENWACPACDVAKLWGSVECDVTLYGSPALLSCVLVVCGARGQVGRLPLWPPRGGTSVQLASSIR
uniref:Uncharacterized protein n=1 Tax=Timema bartmani TaxID=61472 RepID=A0A7R9I0Y2_9NEOP|nr:unnamed protein product [Timema bartmani]